MKLILFIIVALSFIACGKNGGGPSSSHKDRQLEQERTPGLRDRNGYLDASSVGETELLNVTINEAASITEDRVTFTRPVSVQDRGQKFTCALSINAGDIWHLRKSPDSLELELPDGSRKTLRPVGPTAVWFWTGQENGVKISRRYSFLPDRLIINQDCEG